VPKDAYTVSEDAEFNSVTMQNMCQPFMAILIQPFFSFSSFYF